MYSVYVDKDQPKLEQLELLFFIVSVNFQTVSDYHPIAVQHQISSNVQSLV